MIIKKFNLDKKLIHQSLKRNYGLDLLKIFAMINIINLHINLKMKFLKINLQSLKFFHLSHLEFFSYWPVDAFGLISGIVSYKKYKFANIIYLWFIYEFYSILSSIILYYKSKIDTKNFVLSFFPLGIRRNWYVNAYIFMYYFLPFITNSINSINRNFYRKIVIHFFLVYSVYSEIIKYSSENKNFNFINNGYSSLWLFILYIIGGYLGRFIIQKSTISKFLYLQIYLIISFISSEYIIYNTRKYKFQYFMFISYSSPIIIIQALSLIFFFSKLNINNKYLVKVITFLYPLNFSTNIIHTRFFFSNAQSSISFFKFINSLAPKNLFFKIYGISIIIYFICTFIDYFRSLLFKLIRIKSICNFIEKILF